MPLSENELVARYATAEKLLPAHFKKLIDNPSILPFWVKDTDTFWYRSTVEGVASYVLVDATAGTQAPAFDHERLAEALNTVLLTPCTAATLPFWFIEPVAGGIRLMAEQKVIEVSLDNYTAKVLATIPLGEVPSPDYRWSVGLREHNLYLRELSTGEERQLTTDGYEAYEYASTTDATKALVQKENLGLPTMPSIVWAPDSSRFITHRLDQRDLDLMHLVRSAPLDGGKPKLMSYRYATVGDEHVAKGDYFLFEAESGEAVQVKHETVDMPFVPHIGYGWVWWTEDSSAIHWLSSEGRGEKNGALKRIDASNGEVTTLAEEHSATHIHYGTAHYERNIHVLASGEVVWWSEQSGWGQLYLIGTDGARAPITQGEWVVRNLVAVNEDTRTAYFTATGVDPDRDLYLAQLYSASLDGGPITALTDDQLDHVVYAHPKGSWLVDVMSDVSTPTRVVLRDATGAVVQEIVEADATRLYELGWQAPERVKLKAADGVTDIYAAVYKPFDFDPSKSYPVLQEVYGGPQIHTAAFRFPYSGGPMVAERHGAMMAALGFVLVTVDGRGFTLRSKAFRDHSRTVKDAEWVDDHVTAIQQLAADRPWMDLDRVGIFGHSGGGMGSTRAILAAPDFYKVAVSSAGDHDDSLYHAWWGEKYFGLKDEFDYEAHKNVSLVDNLKGKLFLAHGEMDDNVTPHLTMRLVDALIRANKNFDLLIVPNAEHAMFMNNAYWQRRRWDYFVQHLMGETPPEYRIAEVPFDAEMLAAMGG